MHIRRLLLFAVAITMVVVFMLAGASYTKFGAFNSAWADAYTTGSSTGVCNDATLPAPTGGVYKACLYLSGFNEYNVDTLATYGVPCDDVLIYRLGPNGDRGPETSVCNGNVLTVFTEGTGDYIVYYFPGGTKNAPIYVPISSNP